MGVLCAIYSVSGAISAEYKWTDPAYGIEADIQNTPIENMAHTT